MAINGLLEQMCEEEGVGFVDLWGYVVGKEDMFIRDGLHLSGKGAAVFSENLLRSFRRGGTQRSQIHQQRTAWKALRNLVINVFV